MFRSQSGPGALSINTTSANSISTSSSLPPPSGGKSLFGAPATSTTQPQTSSLFATPTAISQPQTTSSLFGNTQPQSQNSQAQQSGGLFGSQSTQQSQGGGLFGNTTSTSQSTGTGLFGSQQPQQNSGGLFGNTNTTQSTGTGLFGSQQTQQNSGGLFGNTTNATQSTGTGLFGSQQQQQNSGGLFGKPLQSQSQIGSGLFGSTMNQSQSQQPNNNAFGSLGNPNNSSIFGVTQAPVQNQQSTMQPPPPPSIFSATIGQHTQQQKTVPGVRISVNELRPTTRFNDLHEELQKAIEQVDNFIFTQMELKKACENESEKIVNMCLQMPPDVQFCTNQHATLQQALENDAESISFAKSLVKADAADAKLSFNVIQNLKLPPQFHQTNLWGTTITPQHPIGGVSDEGGENGGSRNLVEYFSKHADSMSNSLENYKRNIFEVEQHLQGVESNTMQQMQQMMFTGASNGNVKSAEDQVRELAAVLRTFENGILGVATKVGSARESVQDVMLGSGKPNAQGVRETRFGAT